MRRKAVLFVTHEHSAGDASLRYRSFHHAEALGFLGVSCDAVRYGTPGTLEAVADYECVVLHRFPWEAARPFLERAARLGKLVISDTDDLVFDEALSHEIEAIESMPDELRTTWHASYRRAIEACPGAIVATEPLRTRVLRLAPQVEVVPNVVNEEMIRLAERARSRRRPTARHRSDEPLAIAYLSGSRTHGSDFAEASEAVLWALETYPGVSFVAVGDLELDDRFDSFADRVQRIPRRPWTSLPDLLAQADVNLAPLAPTDFSDSKSCVKYLEAALVEVPTIASPRRDFARVIEHGRNGLLANDDAGWRAALRSLVENPGLRAEMGKRARLDVHANHTTRSCGSAVERAWRSLAGSRPGDLGPLTVEWLLDGALRRGRPQDELGVVLRLAGSLAERGHSVRLRLGGSSDEEMRTLRERAGLAAVDCGGFEESTAAEVRIATGTETSYLLAGQDDVLFKFRLVLAADGAGYELPLRHICADPADAERVSELTQRPADLLDPELDPAEGLERLLLDACFVRLPAPQSRPRPRRRRDEDLGDAAARFAALGPWRTRFVIDGVAQGGEFDYADDPRVPAFFRWFGSPATILELSSFEGAHTLQLAAPETTQRVLGLEGRSEHVERSRFVAEVFGRGNIEFALADLESVDLTRYGRFDAAFCAGLLYHLVMPWRLVHEIARVTDRLFLDTHYWAGEEEEFEGRVGGWFEEGGRADPCSGLSGRSFWLSLPSLIRTLTEAGWAVRHIEHLSDWGPGPRVWLGCVWGRESQALDAYSADTVSSSPERLMASDG